ncbi:MAG: hypothetical protein WC725_01665 [Patescibacteria group bacterium]|jgi:hypothetical protein
MNKTITSLVIGAMTLSSIVAVSPALAKNDNNKGKNEEHKNNNSVVTFVKTSDDDSSRLKILTNKNMVKVQEVGKNRTKNSVNLKFKLHQGDDDFKVTVPRGTYTSSSVAFIDAVKQAFAVYKTAMTTAKQNFITAVQAARSAYLTPTTTPTNTAPTIVTAAIANPSVTTGTTSNLSILGADNGGEANLIYTWSVVSKPASALNPTFSVNGNNIAKNTVATFSATGTYQFQATITDAGSLSVTSSLVTVIINPVTANAAPTVTTAAAASPTILTGNSTTLSVLGADDGGENNLTYTWSTVSKPALSAAPTFSINGTNASKNTVATFTSAGNYQLQVTITDSGLLSTTSLVSVTVNQTLTSVSVSPASITVNSGSSTQFTATALDQFNALQASTFSWSIFEGILGGSINGTGLYTATSTTGTFHVIGTSNVDTSKKATSTVIVQ